jgi:hypothetical protein
MEQKVFLRSFIRRIDFEPRRVAIDYTIPVPMEKGKSSGQEVLPIAILLRGVAPPSYPGEAWPLL